MDKLYMSDRFAELWKRSREDCGYSQEYMAKAMGVSKKTVANWESGLSQPSLLKLFEWFDTLCIQPMPYIRRLLYPEYNDITVDSCDDDIDDFLLHLVKEQSPDGKRQLIYLLSGEHGSSPTALLNMITAHLQSPLRDRINIALSISTNYELAQLRGSVVCPDNIQPNTDLLNFAIRAGMHAAVEGREEYTAVLDDEEVNL